MKFVSTKIRQTWKRIKDFCVYKVLHADDPPHRLALGIAIGMFVTFMPLIGFQMMLSVFLAWFLRANKLVGVPLVWISNPLTIIPIYYPCYWIGCKFSGMPVASEEWARLKVNWQMLQANPTTTWGAKVEFWWQGFRDIAGPLGLGCIIVGLSVGVVSYYLSLLAIRRYRFQRWGQLMPPSLTPVDSSHSTGGSQGEEQEESATGGNAA